MGRISITFFKSTLNYISSIQIPSPSVFLRNKPAGAQMWADKRSNNYLKERRLVNQKLAHTMVESLVDLWWESLSVEHLVLLN